jgi:hypothetical protein
MERDSKASPTTSTAFNFSLLETWFFEDVHADVRGGFYGFPGQRDVQSQMVLAMSRTPLLAIAIFPIKTVQSQRQQRS